MRYFAKYLQSAFVHADIIFFHVQPMLSYEHHYNFYQDVYII